jgi:hypothetical protein
MRNRWWLGLILVAGCGPLPTLPEESATPQVASMPFTEPGRPAPTRVNYAPASQETSDRVVMVKYKLVGPQPGGLPIVTAIGAADPEIFHVGQDQIFITEGLVRQCVTEGQLAAVLAYEMGQMISEREAVVSDEVRQPERLPPIELRNGIGSTRESDPTYFIERAMYEKNHPKQAKKLTRPNPQVVARNILEQHGYQSTDLDAALPILQSAERNQVLQNQLKGSTNQGDWKQPY